MSTTAERNEKILEAYRAGATLRQLGKEYDLTWQRVSQLLHRMGEFSGESRRGRNLEHIEQAQRKREEKAEQRQAVKTDRRSRLQSVSDIWLSDLSPEEKATQAGFSKPASLYAFAHRHRAKYPELFPYRPSGQGRRDATQS
jgi:hypothetical protein